MIMTREEMKKALGIPTNLYDRCVGFECSLSYYNEFMRVTSNIDNIIKSHATALKKWPIDRVIFNPPATIVFWSDGTKTVVKAQNEVFDWEKGLAMAVCKKALANNNGYYYNLFKAYEEAGVKAAYEEAMKFESGDEDILI